MTGVPVTLGQATVPTLRVAETFGPTVQGEGPSTGRPAMFIRLWGCNLDCWWCDTPYTWDTTGKTGTVYDRDTESQVVPVLDLVADLPDDINLVVITGGEPTIQSTNLVHLIEAILATSPDRHVEVETNGTRVPPVDHERVVYNVSPKLAHALTTKPSLRPEVLAAYNQLEHSPALFKFVVQNPVQLEEVDDLVATVGIDPNRIWIMPEGRSANDLADRANDLVDDVIDRRYNITSRLHVLLWGDIRGV